MLVPSPKIVLIAVLAVFGALAVLTAGAADAPLKVGFVYVSPVGDAGWTSQHDAARKEMEKALDGKVVTKYVENVPEGADAERVIRELAQSGYQLIFTTSFGYMNPTIKVAKQFPKTYFEHATGYKTDKNVGIYNARFYEGRYLAGIVAGRMTKSNVAGYVAAFPIPEVVMGINAFTRGMRSVNPNAVTKVVWVNTWYDPGREREAADTLISQGADVLTNHTDSTAVVQDAEAKKSQRIRTVASLRSTLGPCRKRGERVALVPTMGALHRGHMALVREAGRRANRVVVSVFVNPTQFAPHEDFASYPRSFATDLKALRDAKVDLVWAPSVETMYPDGFATRLAPGRTGQSWIGRRISSAFLRRCSNRGR